MSSSVQSLIDFGTAGLTIDIECHLSNNLPNIVIVGFANKAVDEARERVRGAFASCGIDLPRKRITINLAPAEVPKASTSFDLAIAAAIILSAVAQSPGKHSQPAVRQFASHEAIMGELGLDGVVRPVRGIIGKILSGRQRGITTFYIPAGNLPQAALIPDVRLVPIRDLRQLYEYILGQYDPDVVVGAHPAQPTSSGTPAPTVVSGETPDETISLSDIIGQEQAKRALEIAAAGGHNILLNGPPGTGKSMLARALPSIMPAMGTEEMLEVTHLHSLSSREYDRLITERPFRAPHHSASHTAVVGGGSAVRPGEISLAHHGILFFDEFPEFGRSTIEALRQPLEDRLITIARANDRIEFPANFILIATSNPCPCGYYGVPNPDGLATRVCTCSPAIVQNYRSKLSGPILDRIDLYTEVHTVDHVNLLQSPDKTSKLADSAVRERVAAARARQAARYQSNTLNASMTNRAISSQARLSADAKTLLDTAGRSLDLSARAYIRTVKVARTIADLADSETIEAPHITEALQYRSRNYHVSM